MGAVTQDNVRTKNGWNTDMVIVPSVLAATATVRQPVFVAPVNIELGEVALVNSTIVTGHGSNTKNLNLIDGGAEGAGTAEIANIDMGSGTDLVVGKTLLFDNIQGASATRYLSQGDILELEFEQVGSGVLVNPTLAYITWRVANLAS